MIYDLGWIRSNSRKRSEVENLRDRQIREIVAHAYANVPFYRRLTTHTGFLPARCVDTAEEFHLMAWECSATGDNPLHETMSARVQRWWDVALTVSIKRRLAVAFILCACGGEHPTASSLTPWSELPPISKEGKVYLKLTNIDYYAGVVTRWTNQEPPLVYAPHVSEQDQADAIAMLDSITGGGITVRFVDTEVEANVVVKDVWPPATYVAPSTCGLARVTKTVDYVIVRGEIDFNPRPPCVLDDGEHRRNILAHELGHVLGFREHTPGVGDIMSAVATWKTSAVLMEVGRWLYKVPPGTKPI